MECEIISFILKVLIAPLSAFIIFITKTVFGWREFVSDWCSKNKGTANLLHNKWAMFHYFTFSTGASDECRSEYEKELKGRKIRCRYLFESYVIMNERRIYKKLDKDKALELRKEINRSIPGLLD
jgi:hypothetical protein